MDAGVVAMFLARFINGTLNFIAVFLMRREGTPEAGLKYNSYLALAGSTAFLFVSIIGIAGVATRMDPAKLALTILGIILIEIGIRPNI